MCENIVESIPEWLNGNFLEKYLQNHYKNDEINVINYNVKASTARGENIYRIRLSFGVSLAGEEVSCCSFLSEKVFFSEA